MPVPRRPIMPETAATPGLYRLLAWASPSFPTGAFSYSHGLEAAVAEGTVHDRAGLQAWIASVVAHGSGRIDADTLRDAYRAAERKDLAALDATNRRGAAYRATAELALESGQQGEAFRATCRAAWALFSDDRSHGSCYSAAFGAAAAGAGIELEDALVGYLHAFAGNLMSAGIRLGVIGQTDGQRIVAALEPVVMEAATAALARDPADYGAATFAVDLASMAHETQSSRLFRS